MEEYNADLIRHYTDDELWEGAKHMHVVNMISGLYVEKCPSCGKRIEHNGKQENAKCSNCGKEYKIDTKYYNA